MKRVLFAVVIAATMVMLVSASALADRGPVCCIQPTGWSPTGD